MKISKKEIRNMVAKNFMRVLNESMGYPDENEMNARKLEAACRELRRIYFSPDSTSEERDDAKTKMDYIAQYKTPHEVNMEIEKNGCAISNREAEEYIDSILKEGVGGSYKVTLYDETIDGSHANEMAETMNMEDGEQAAAKWFEEVTTDGRWEEGEMPKYHRFVCDLPQTGVEMYYDYGADYYFAVKK